MNKIIIALGVALVSATSAFADSSALDVVGQQTVVNASAVDYTAPAATSTADAYGMRARLGDGSPMNAPVAVSVDYTAPASIGATGYVVNDRIGGNS